MQREGGGGQQERPGGPGASKARHVQKRRILRAERTRSVGDLRVQRLGVFRRQGAGAASCDRLDHHAVRDRTAFEEMAVSEPFGPRCPQVRLKSVEVCK